jgi:hypothetical protein
MPICERDPWRFQFFEGVSCPEHVRVPTDDIDCHAWFPVQRWVYEKINIARSQNMACGLAQDMPAQFPVFAKPNINLRGMGLDSHIIRTRSEFAAVPDGHMWMPLLEGEHISTDCAVVDGTMVWLRHAIGHPWHQGMFTHWVIENTQRAELELFLSSWIARHMTGYTGMMNFETIGGAMIEAHLRFADQWCDLYGRPWLEALVGLYAEATWTLEHEVQHTGFSIPLFARHGLVPPHPTAAQQQEIRAMPYVSSLQITYFQAKADEAHAMPPGGFRLGIINCTDFAAGLKARAALAQCFPGVEVMLPQTVFDQRISG